MTLITVRWYWHWSGPPVYPGIGVSVLLAKRVMTVMMAVMTQLQLPWPGSWQGHSGNQVCHANHNRTQARAQWAITSIAPHTAQWSPEGEEELPVTTAVCSALWDTRPWLQDDSIRLESNGKLEKKEKKLWANVKQHFLCKYLIKSEESNSEFVS